MPKVGRGISSPFVEVEVIGTHYDNYKYKTGTRCKSSGNLSSTEKRRLESFKFVFDVKLRRLAFEQWFFITKFLRKKLFF